MVVNYALAPSVSIDEITRQARASLAWVLRYIGEYGGDPERAAIGGHSAGGHLTAMGLQTRWAEDYGLPRDPFKAAVLVSGLFDLQPLPGANHYSAIYGFEQADSPLCGWVARQLGLDP
ncbi:MAG: alpha/beta hydrolase [Pseudomonadota bacterium]